MGGKCRTAPAAGGYDDLIAPADAQGRHHVRRTVSCRLHPAHSCRRSAGDQPAADLVRQYEPTIRRVVRSRRVDARLGAVLDSMDICQSVLASFFVRTAAGQFEFDSPEDLV